MSDILVADDEKGIREGVKALLECEGHAVRLAKNGDEVLAEYRARRPDLLILDVMMPKKSGYDVIARIRKDDPALQVIFLSARTRAEDKVLGLNLGADDYVAKPFKTMELVARVEAALRRSRLLAAAPAAAPEAPARPAGPAPAAPAEDDAPFAFGAWRVDPARQLLVPRDGPGVPLGRREVGVLRLLAAAPGVIVRRERFLSELWGDDYPGTTRTLDTCICGLRRKLGAEADRVETVVGTGYRYRPAP